MFGFSAFAEIPYSTLPGGAILAFISESASAQDAVLVDASTFNANSSESVQALDSVSSAAVFFGSVLDSATGQDTAVAFVVLPASVADSATANDQIIGSLLLSATISELVTGAETVSAQADFNSSASETAQGSDQSVVVASTFSAQSSESSTASDSQTAQTVFPASLAELASASESTVAALAFLGSVSEIAQAFDSVLAAQGHSSVIAETATAAELVSVVASTFSAQSSETASGSDSTSLVVVFRGAVAEQLSSSDLTSVAASIFNAVSQEQAQAQDSVDAPGSTYNPSTSETAQALDTPSAAATFPVAASETATIADQNAAAFTAATNISESATAADTTAALVAFAALTAENASASDQTLVVPSTFNAIAAAAAQAFDSVNAPGSIYNAAVVNTAVALDSIIGAFLWNLIDDSQGTGWTLISVAATSEPSWTSSAASPTALISINYNNNVNFGAGYLLYTGGQTNYYMLPVTGGTNTISSAFYVNGQFFVIGVQYGSGVMLRSADGRNWTTVTVPNPSSPVLTVFGNGTQLGILNGGSTHISTDNGSTWTTGAAGQATFSYRTDVVWDGTKYVLNDGRRIRTSTDGLNWTIRFTAGIGRDRGSLIWTGSAFVAVFSSVISPTTTAQIRVSADGVTWNTPTPSFSNAVSLFQGPGLVGLFQKNGSVVALSGITGTNFTATFLTNVPGYTYYPNDSYGFQVAQLGGLYFVPGVGESALTSKYITTTAFQSYATRTVAGVSPWIGIDDNQSPNWQNISNS